MTDVQEQYSNGSVDDGYVSRRVSPTPKSELDFNMMTTDTVWGQDLIPKYLRERLTKQYIQRDSFGNPLRNVKNEILITKEGMWEILGYFTRDLRLGNLTDGSNPFGTNELAVVRYHLDLASDYLSYEDDALPSGFTDSFRVHMTRVAGILETSHSKKGWFRKKASTYTQEYTPIKPENAPANKNFFGAPKKEEGQE